ncbi:MAG: aldo/keto reductase [Selenomonadaceae bacterium]|nr:aldo/keto reductase [Selenomonadaceae bacterium]
MSNYKLGFGMMRLPELSGGEINFSESCAMVDEFLSSGGKYFDTSYVYQGGHNEETVRKVLVERHARDEFELATKLPTFFMDSKEKVRATFEKQLNNLGVEYLDRYLLHSIYSTTYDSKILAYEMFDFGREMKRQGKIREFGFSFHDTPEILDRVLTEQPDTDFVQLVINYYDWESPFIQARRSYEVARRHGVKIFVMEPVKGGLLAKLPAQIHDALKKINPDASDASYGFRFAAGLAGVEIILSGMSSMAQVKDNVALAKNFVPLSSEEKSLLFDAVKIFKESGPVARSDFSVYENICENGMPVAAVLDAYNSIMVQNANGFVIQEENGYDRGLQFLAGRKTGKTWIEGRIVDREGNDITELVRAAEDYLIKNTFL